MPATSKTDSKTTTATLLADIQKFISTYVQLGADELIAASLWVLHTWTFGPEVPHPYTTPYLYIHSAEKQSGKTRLLEVLETIIRNPLRAADVTSAVLFRTIEMNSSTMMIDEVDAIWAGAKNEELRGVLNAGYKRGGKVPRVERGEVRTFNVFAPKALAGIDNAMLPDTISDRCIPIHMHRQKRGESTPFYSYMVDSVAEELCERINEWVKTDYPKLAVDMPKPLDGISDRANEIAMPLLQLAKGFRTTTYRETAAAIKRLLSPQSDGRKTPAQEMLQTIRDLFAENNDAAALPTAMIIERLNGDDGRGHWNGKLLANKLHPYNVKTGAIRYKNNVVRGVKFADMKDAWERYLD